MGGAKLNKHYLKESVLKVFKTLIYILRGIRIFVVLKKGEMQGETDESQICG
jgi:hypothetical protein